MLSYLSFNESKRDGFCFLGFISRVQSSQFTYFLQGELSSQTQRFRMRNTTNFYTEYKKNMVKHKQPKSKAKLLVFWYFLLLVCYTN